MSHARWRVRLGALLAAGCVLGSLAPARGAAPVTRAPRIESFDVTLIDVSRPTEATSATPGFDQRVLETTITHPVGVKDRLPLIVLAHGNDGHPRKFLELISAWAEAGYVVAAPAFPLTNDTTPGGSNPGDVANQPADMTFVIDEVLKMARNRKSPIFRLVDKRRIGAAGLSLGGGTVYGLVYHSCCIDERVDAALLMAAVRLDFQGGTADWRRIPALLMHGDADPLYGISENTYPLLAPPKWFVTLHASTHAAPFEDSDDPADDAVGPISVAFWDRYLKGDRAAAKRIVDAVDEYGEAELQRELR
jgi:dienelactone hydrolase